MPVAKLKVGYPWWGGVQVCCITAPGRCDAGKILFTVSGGIRRVWDGSVRKRFVKRLPAVHLRIVQEFKGIVAHITVVVVVTAAAGKEKVAHHHFLKRISITTAYCRSKRFEECRPGLFSCGLLPGRQPGPRLGTAN